MSRTKKILFIGLIWSLFFLLAEGASLLLLQKLPLLRERNLFAETIHRERLNRPKLPNEKRIFLLGASTMEGHHLNHFSTPELWMKMLIQDACLDPAFAGSVRIVNFSRGGRGTDFILYTLRQLLRYEPDAFIVYTAHNEFLSINTKFHKKSYGVKNFLRQSRFLQLVEEVVEGGRDALRVIRKKRKPYRIGIAKETYTEEDIFYPFSPKRAWIETHYRKNIETLLGLCRDRRIPCLVSTFVSNESDFPPRLSVSSTSLEPAGRFKWEMLTQEAEKRMDEKRWDEALFPLEEADRLLPHHAETHYRLGKCYQSLGDPVHAEAHFTLAIEYDLLPHRGSPRWNDFLMAAAETNQMPVVDVRTAIKRHSPDGLIGDDLILDNCHLNLFGHYLMGRVFLEGLASVPGFEAAGWDFGRIGDFEHYRENLSIRPEDLAKTYKNIGIYLGSRLEQAAAYYQKALELVPEDPEAKKFLILAYYQMRQLDQMGRWMEEMKSRHPGEYEEMLTIYPELR